MAWPWKFLTVKLRQTRSDPTLARIAYLLFKALPIQAVAMFSSSTYRPLYNIFADALTVHYICDAKKQSNWKIAQSVGSSFCSGSRFRIINSGRSHTKSRLTGSWREQRRCIYWKPKRKRWHTRQLCVCPRWGHLGSHTRKRSTALRRLSVKWLSVHSCVCSVKTASWSRILLFPCGQRVYRVNVLQKKKIVFFPSGYCKFRSVSVGRCSNKLSCAWRSISPRFA